MHIVTDSAADLTAQDIQTWGIKVVPLNIQFPQGEVSSSDISADDFYDRLRAMAPAVPTTSQPSPAAFMEWYEASHASGEELLSIHISSGLSGTLNAAKVAAGQIPNARIRLIDTYTLSPAQRFQVLTAAMAIKAGWSSAQIIERLDKIRHASEAIFTLETLDYLARGGRIGRVQALAGSLLHIKPVIHVDTNDGKYSTVGRARTMGQALKTITGHLTSVYGDKPVWTTVIHGQLADKATELDAMLRAALNVGRSDMVRISPVLGVHTGPGVVGVGVMPLELIADL
ncbi:MAG: DegV family protein [Anaerolineae bacterium]|nr:DegV family protein [Anaerolineae bacterium]NUQ03326.1 DegV family protein [Anaerolineae bacterium]